MYDNNYIHYGPELCRPLSTESLGIQIYNSLINNPNKTDAFIHGITNERVSFKQLLEITCRLAESLKNAGYRKNDMISICSENSLSFFYPVIAALYLGIVVAPLNHDYLEGELLHSAGISKPKIIFCSKAVLPKIIKLKSQVTYIEKIILLDDSNGENVETLNEFMQTNSHKYFDEYTFRPIDLNVSEHLAVVLCSSGTTGLPKGVMTTHENINVRLNHVFDERMHIQSKQTDSIKMGLMPFFHGFGFMTSIGSMVAGDTIVVLPRFEEKTFLGTIEKYKISNLWIVPPLILFLAKSPLVDQYDLSSIQELLSGAAPLSRATEELVMKRLKVPFIRQAYGMTELTLAVLIMPQGIQKLGSSGTVVPGMTCKIQDPETGRTLGPNEVGELCFKGKMAMKGYYANPAATKQTFDSDGWLITGDLAYFDQDGYFYIVDRLKELIKYKGFQVAPAELEALLLTHHKILDVGVVGKPDEVAGDLTVAFVVKQPGVALTEVEVQDYVAQKVSHAKRLHGGVRFVNAIPKNPSGKILRRKLREMVNNDVKSKL